MKAGNNRANRQRWARSGLVVSVLTAIVVGLSAPGAHAQSPDPTSKQNAPVAATAASGPEHCAIVIKKVEPGQAESKVVSKQCADSAAALNASAPGAAADFGTPLFRLYGARNFTGTVYTIYGYDGPCDRAGYRYPTLGWAYNDFAYSIELAYPCNTANIHEHANWGGAVARVYGKMSDLGYLNGRVSSIAVWYS
ncbi:hypothetical protein ACFY2M_41550 [Streptomyces sp. NPDC001276]|uniref:hypothetical protein n=1 Tax=Streptomyces sp. NPDC001276 TaxID=3364555 RepID=UPI0036C15B6C